MNADGALVSHDRGSKASVQRGWGGAAGLEFLAFPAPETPQRPCSSRSLRSRSWPFWLPGFRAMDFS